MTSIGAATRASSEAVRVDGVGFVANRREGLDLLLLVLGRDDLDLGVERWSPRMVAQVGDSSTIVSQNRSARA